MNLMNKDYYNLRFRNGCISREIRLVRENIAAMKFGVEYWGILLERTQEYVIFDKSK